MNSVAPVKASTPLASYAGAQTAAPKAPRDDPAIRAVEPAAKSESAPKADTQQRAADNEAVQQALRKIDARLPVNVKLDIYLDEATNRTVVRGVSEITGETVIEWPTEEMLSLIKGLRSDLGLAVNETA